MSLLQFIIYFTNNYLTTIFYELNKTETICKYESDKGLSLNLFGYPCTEILSITSLLVHLLYTDIYIGKFRKHFFRNLLFIFSYVYIAVVFYICNIYTVEQIIFGFIVGFYISILYSYFINNYLFDRLCVFSENKFLKKWFKLHDNIYEINNENLNKKKDLFRILI